MRRQFTELISVESLTIQAANTFDGLVSFTHDFELGDMRRDLSLRLNEVGLILDAYFEEESAELAAFAEIVLLIAR